MRIKLKKTTFGSNQDCTLDIINRVDGVHIDVIKAEHPLLVNEDVIIHLVNEQRGDYDRRVTSMKKAKEVANSGFLNDRVQELKKALNEAEFAQKIARRNNVFIHDKSW